MVASNVLFVPILFYTIFALVDTDLDGAEPARQGHWLHLRTRRLRRSVNHALLFRCFDFPVCFFLLNTHAKLASEFSVGVGLCVRVYMRVYVCTCVCIVYMRVYMYMREYVYMRVCVSVCIYIY